MTGEFLGVLALILLPLSFGLNAWLVHRWLGRMERKTDKLVNWVTHADSGIFVRLARLEAAKNYDGPERRRHHRDT